jgi:hypothetical protein
MDQVMSNCFQHLSFIWVDDSIWNRNEPIPSGNCIIKVSVEALAEVNVSPVSSNSRGGSS